MSSPQPNPPEGKILDLRNAPSQAEQDRLDEERKTRFKARLKIFFFFVAAYYLITAGYDYYMEVFHPEEVAAAQKNANPLHDAVRFRQGIALVLQQQDPNVVLPTFAETDHGYTLTFPGKDTIEAIYYPETETLYNVALNIVIDNENGLLSKEEFATLRALVMTCEKLNNPTAPDSIADDVLAELKLSMSSVPVHTKEKSDGFEYRLIVGEVNTQAHSDVPGLTSGIRKTLSLSATPLANL